MRLVLLTVTRDCDNERTVNQDIRTRDLNFRTQARLDDLHAEHALRPEFDGEHFLPALGKGGSL